MILALSYAPVGWGRNAAIRAGALVEREFVGGTWKLHTEAADEQRALAVRLSALCVAFSRMPGCQLRRW